jgi:cytochrome c-type biogenesis protein CcmH
MLLFWACAALLTVLVVIATVRPLLRNDDAASPERTATDVAVYRDRIAEIEVERARGLISEAEAEAARIELARRLLTASSEEDDKASGAPASTASAGRRGGERAFMLVAGIIPVVAIGLYAALGSPTLPGRPVAERLAKAPSPNAAVEELVARVETQLRANPGDGQGWDVVAPVYLRLERFHDAAEAFKRAIDLLGETPRRLSGLAESTVLANDGIVTETARKAYQRLIELEPGRTEALFGLALAKEQDGDLDEAEAQYRKLAENAPPQAPWRVFVMERLEAIAQKKGAPAAPDTTAADAIASLPEGQRRQVILQMVEGLNARLKANGRDLEGWQKLVRSWTVMGERDKAEAALVEARKALAGDARALGALDAFAKGLGLKS